MKFGGDQMATRKSQPKKECAKCKKTYSLTQFYAADPPFFPDGRLHICKKCVYEIIDEQGFDGFKSLLRLIDKPLLKEFFNGNYRDYIKMIPSVYKNSSFEDSDMFKEVKTVGSFKKSKPKELTEEEFLESEDFWGRGFTEDEYIFLNSEFSDYLNRYEVDSKGMETLIQEICLTKLDIRKRRANGESVDKQLKTLQDLLGSSNLKPVQETGANAVEQETFGTLIKKYERERPIPEPDPQWKDVDNIGKYLRTFFFGHMARALGMENKFQDEYEKELNKYTVRPEEVDDDGEL